MCKFTIHYRVISTFPVLPEFNRLSGSRVHDPILRSQGGIHHTLRKIP